MMRFLFLLAFAALLVVPGEALAQKCDPKSPTVCTGGTVCKDISGTGQYFCSAPGVIPVQVTTQKDTDIGGDTDKDIGGDTDTDIGGDTDTDIGGDMGGGGGGLTNPLKDIDSLPELLKVVLDAIVQLGTIILTLALVYVGFLFVVAQGNEEKITNAKNALLWTVIGGLILLGASAIGAVIGSTVETFTQ